MDKSSNLQKRLIELSKLVILLTMIIPPLKGQNVGKDSIYQWKQNTKGNFGLTLNTKGKESIVIPYEYGLVKDLSEDLCAIYSTAKNDFKWALFHKQNVKFATPFIYRGYEVIQDGYVAVQQSDSKWGIVDNNGKEVCPPKFDRIDKAPSGQKLALAQIGDKYGFINKEGITVIPFEYDETFGFPEKEFPYTVVSKAKKRGVINSDGKIIIPLKYDFLVFNKDVLSNKMSDTLMAGINGEMGFIKIDETIVVPMEYDDFKWPSEGLIAAAKKGSKYGFINYSNQPVIEFIYQDVRGFSEGLAAVYDGQFWGFIDKKGKKAIPLKFDSVTNFYKGESIVSQGEKSFYIDKKGKFLRKDER